MQQNAQSSSNKDLHNNLLTDLHNNLSADLHNNPLKSSDYQEVNNNEVILEEDEYKEYKYRF